MVKVLLTVLVMVLVGTSIVMSQDPPLPDAVAFCQHMDQENQSTYCTCATANNGHLCSSEEPLPNWCKRMCGHAKDCHCCGVHQ